MPSCSLLRCRPTTHARSVGVICEYVVTGLQHQLRGTSAGTVRLRKTKSKPCYTNSRLDAPGTGSTSHHSHSRRMRHSGRVRGPLRQGVPGSHRWGVRGTFPMSAEDRVRLMDLAEFVLTRGPVELDPTSPALSSRDTEIDLSRASLELKVDGVAADRLIAWQRSGSGIERQRRLRRRIRSRDGQSIHGESTRTIKTFSMAPSARSSPHTETILDRVGMGDDGTSSQSSRKLGRRCPEVSDGLPHTGPGATPKAVLQVVQGLPLGELAHMARVARQPHILPNAACPDGSGTVVSGQSMPS